METACDIITVCCVLQNCCLLSKDSGEDCIDDVENQELDVYNDQPLNDVVITGNELLTSPSIGTYNYILPVQLPSSRSHLFFHL
jgi:hypothetical protein